MTEHSHDLILQSVWRHETLRWPEYFVVCSNRVFPIRPLVISQIDRLPERATRLLPKRRDRRPQCKIDYDVPTENTFGKVRYIGTQFGDDVNIVLANGCAIVYYLESNPQAVLEGCPENFRCAPVILFLEPEDFAGLDVDLRKEDMQLLTIRYLEESTTG